MIIPFIHIAASSGLFLNKCALQRMRIFDGPEALDRRYLALAKRSNRRNTGPRCSAVDQHSASTALCQPAAEFGPIKLQVVPKYIKKRRICLGRRGPHCAIDL